MQESKLVLILKNLEKEEIKKFGRFINSPYFNSQKNLIKFYDLLFKSYPDFADKRINKEFIWKKLNPTKPYNSKKMIDLMSEMTGMLRKFLAVEAYSSNEFLFGLGTAMAFSQKNFYKYFVEEVQKVEKALDEKNEYSSIYQLLRFILKKETYYHQLGPKGPEGVEILLDANQYLENYFLSFSSKLALETQIRSKIFSKDEIISVDHLEQAFNLSNIKDPLAKIYFNLIAFQQKPDLELLPEIQKILDKNYSRFSKEDKSIIIYALINQTNKALRGNPKLIQQLLSFFKLGLKEYLFISKGVMKHTTFLNIGIAAAIAKDFDFLVNFQKNYQQYLSEEIKEDCLILIEAYRLFHLGAFDDATMQLLKLNRVRRPEFEVRIRTLEIRCTFETALDNFTEWEFLFSKINNFEKYLQRDGVLAKRIQKSYLSFVRLTNKIAKAISSNNLDETKVEKLETELLNYENITAFNWLLEKIRGDSN